MRNLVSIDFPTAFVLAFPVSLGVCFCHYGWPIHWFPNCWFFWSPSILCQFLFVSYVFLLYIICFLFSYFVFPFFLCFPKINMFSVYRNCREMWNSTFTSSQKVMPRHPCSKILWINWKEDCRNTSCTVDLLVASNVALCFWDLSVPQIQQLKTEVNPAVEDLTPVLLLRFDSARAVSTYTSDACTIHDMFYHALCIDLQGRRLIIFRNVKGSYPWLKRFMSTKQQQIKVEMPIQT